MDERILKYFQNSLAPNERLLLLREIEKNEELKKQFAEYQNIQALLNLSSHTEDKKEGETSYQHFQKRIKSKKMRIWLVKTMKYAAAILILMISTYQLSIWQMSHKLQDDFQVQTNTLCTSRATCLYIFARWYRGLVKCSIDLDLPLAFLWKGKNCFHYRRSLF